MLESFVESGAIAALVVGSAADGTSDEFSDLDLVVFHEQVPARDRRDGRLAPFSPSDLRPLGGSPADGFVLEQWTIDGIACQFVHQTTDCWRETSASVLRDLATDSPVQKALWGLQSARVVHGQDLVEGLRTEAAYPEGLGAAMVQANLDVFPLWRMAEALARRDAEWWQRSELVRGLGNVLAILAGANGVYFSRFQLKHLRSWAASLSVAPTGLVERLEAALVAPLPTAAFLLEALVTDSLDVADARLGDQVDTSGLRRLVGGRQSPWSLPSAASGEAPG